MPNSSKKTSKSGKHADNTNTTKSGKHADNTKTDTSAAAAFPHLTDGTHDLAALHVLLKPVDESFRRLFFRPHDEAKCYARGITATTEDILEDVPRFVSSSLRILSSLDERRRALVMLPPAIFGVLVDEAVKLEALLQSHGDVSTSEAQDVDTRARNLKKEMSAGVTLRDRVLGAARNAIGQERLDAVRKKAGDASTPASLAKGLRAVASFVKEIHAGSDADDQSALLAFGVPAARAAELDAKADALEALAPPTAATGTRVSQRKVDIGDGRVLLLMEAVLRGFRLARRSDKSILAPALQRLANLFDTRSSAGAADAAEPEAPAAPPATAGQPA